MWINSISILNKTLAYKIVGVAYDLLNSTARADAKILNWN